MKITKNVRFALTTALLVFGVAFLGFGLTKSVSAASFQAPDPDFFSPDGGDVLLVASYAGGANGLDSRVITVMAYFDNPSGNTIVIGNGRDNCGIPGNNTGPDGTGPADTDFVFRDIGVGGGFINSMARNSGSLSCGSDSISVPTLKEYTIPGTNIKKYVVKVTATNNTPASINGFRVSVLPGQGVMSFYDQSTRQFAIQDRNDWGPTPGNETTMDLAFGPSCTFKPGDTAVLQWYDDDWGTGNQGPNMRMQLIEDGTLIATKPTSDFRGPGVGGSWDVGSLIRPGHKYKWRWVGVSERNGIQFQLPFDSFYYGFDCGNEPQGNVGSTITTCDSIQGWAFDQDSGNTKIRVLLRVNGVNKSYHTANIANPDPNATNIDKLIGPNHGYKIDYRAYKDTTADIVEVFALDVDSNGNETGNSTRIGFAGVGPCSSPTCSVSIVGVPGVNERFTVTANFSLPIGARSTDSVTLWNMTLSIDGSASNYTISGANPAGGGIAPGEDGGSASWDVVIKTSGYYTGKVALTGAVTKDCQFPVDGCPPATPRCIPVPLKPYVRVWAGDVLAGCDVSDVWKPRAASPGKILTWQTLGGNGTGSGTDFAVQALGTIGSFSSRQNSLTATDTLDKSMTFANVGAGSWGGSFGSGLCPKEYTLPAGNGQPIPADVNTAADTASYNGGSLNGATIGIGKHITLYVDGDLTINNDIGYQNSGTSWASISDIPSLTVIVKGDIKIAPGVQNLSGTYIAVPKTDTDGGTIYTCSAGTNSKTDLLNNCRTNSALTIYGSFIARTVKFTRLSGTASQADPAQKAGVGTAAEKFIYSPELWLPSGANSSTTGKYDSITSLPPVF